MNSGTIRLKGFPRWIDIAAAGTGLVLCSPLFALLAILVRLSSPGPVFYKGRRAGANGTEFGLYKFRSMVTDADKTGALTKNRDPRVTPAGYWLRKTKLDELPQLLNVLRGEISLVGPRPEDPRYIPYYPEDCRIVLSIKPGITSAASLYYHDESALLTGEDPERTYIDVILPAKLRIDREYFVSATVWAHFGLIIKTVISIVKKPRKRATSI